MNSLVINLLLPLRSGWLVVIHLLVGLFCLPVVLIPIFNPAKAEAEGLFLVYVVTAFILGQLVTGIQKETMVKPFSFCLPGHRNLPRRIIFTIGLVASALLGLIFLRFPGLIADQGWPKALLAAWTAGCVAGLLYLAGVAFAWRTATANGIFLIFLVSLLREWVDPQRRLAGALGDWAPLATLAAAAVGILVWRHLRGDRQARLLCGTSYLAAHEIFNRARVLEHTQRNRTPEGRESLQFRLLARAFLRGFGSSSPPGAGRTVLREGFTSLMRLLPKTTAGFSGQIAALVLLVALLGYGPTFGRVGGRLGENLIFLYPFVVAMGLSIPLFGTQLLTVGRKGRMRNAWFVGSLGGVLACVLCGAIYLLSRALGHVMPAFAFLGEPRAFQPLTTIIIHVPLLALPVAYGLDMVFGRWATIPQLILTVIVALWLMFGQQSLRPETPWVVGGLILLFWTVFFLHVRYYCRYEDLIRQ